MYMDFVAIAYKIPYYEDTARIYYDGNVKKYMLWFKNNEYHVLQPDELEKGEIEVNGNMWKFSKINMCGI